MKIDLKKYHQNMVTISEYLKNYNKIYIIILGLISLFEVIMMIYGLCTFDFAKTSNLLYMCSYIFLFTASIVSLIFLLRYRKVDNSIGLGLTFHIYALLILIWALLISTLDMMKGNTPIVYLTIMIVVCGIAILDPVYFSIGLVLSLITIFTLNGIYHFECFNNWGYYFNFFVFVIMSLFVAFRNYKVNINDSQIKMKLKRVSQIDQLTGLGSESYYITKVAELERQISRSSAKFALVVMDVNNVKKTNDENGHIYGCNLIVTAGKTLPSIFKDSEIFHIGGDEFVAIVQGNDYERLGDILKEFDEKLKYKMITYKGKELTLSVARGIAIYEYGMIYNDVFQRADDAMYENKKEIKKEYNLADR